jgi:lysozyme
MDKLIEQIKRHEGYRKRMYLCTAGKETIGYGYNLKANPLHLSSLEIGNAYKNGMNEVEAERLLKLMVSKCVDQLEEAIPVINRIDMVRQDILINMTYNMGLIGLLKFKKMLLALKKKDYKQASIEMLNSKWKDDVGNRAQELATQMLTGAYADGA